MHQLLSQSINHSFVNDRLAPYPNSRIALIWDGATYPRAKEMKAYLESLNQGLDESNWKITCIRFAANDLKQNPIEDIGCRGSDSFESTITCVHRSM